LKVAFVIVGGFYFTLLTTSGSVLGIRQLLPPKTTFVTPSRPLEEITQDDEPVNAATSDNDPPPKPFSNDLVTILRVLKACSGVAAAVACRSSALAPLEAPLTTAFLLFATLHGFVFGARLPNKFTKIVHPLVTCTLITWSSANLLGLVNGYSFATMLGKYKTGRLPPTGTGAGDLLLFLLGPAVVSLACQMYDRRKLMKRNLAEVATAVGVSSFGGLFGTAAVVRWLEIGSPAVRLSLLSRNITSPLAMAMAKILGADVSLAVSMVVVTGLIGANFGAFILDAFGIKDAVARGLGIGAAAHGLGTAAFANEDDAFPFAAIAMALTASACTVLISIPFIKKLVLQLALGW
jgi:putative effector of murein hydrolase